MIKSKPIVVSTNGEMWFNILMTIMLSIFSLVYSLATNEGASTSTMGAGTSAMGITKFLMMKNAKGRERTGEHPSNIHYTFSFLL